jgi:hypothetical protein
LSGGQPYISNKNVVENDAVFPANDQFPRLGRGLQRLQRDRPIAGEICHCSDPLTGKSNHDPFSWICPSPDRCRTITLYDHVIGKDFRQTNVCPGNDGRSKQENT